MDALLTRSEGERLARWVDAACNGTDLLYIYVTRGHADHFFGAGPALHRFPGAELVTHLRALDGRFHPACSRGLDNFDRPHRRARP